MTYTDEAIEAVLGSLRPIGYRHAPCAGTWNPLPFADRTIDGRTVAVLCDDPGLEAIVVRRDDGRVIHLDPDSQPMWVNDSLRQFVACARAYERAVREANAVDEDDDALRAVQSRLRAELAVIDPTSIVDDRRYWMIAVIQLAYRM